ncbi:UNVERIFIED_CONTAM: hypothetical protein GTU68_018618 [Idotea baltica]|nr:hypothetical protein [Idotea baltica]
MSHDDFAFEEVKGLPERPPEGEEILWQGRPATWALAREALMINWIAFYFLLLLIWRIGVSSTVVPFGTALGHGVPFLLLGVIVYALLLFVAWAQARGTVYTLTTHRVAMRVGAALQITYNLPFKSILNASLDQRAGGTGTIALEMDPEAAKLSYLMMWPHVRPWRMANTEPALRCIPDAARVAGLLADAAETRISVPEITRVADGNAVPAE